jgi:hypothetical protein
MPTLIFPLDIADPPDPSSDFAFTVQETVPVARPGFGADNPGSQISTKSVDILEYSGAGDLNLPILYKGE